MFFRKFNHYFSKGPFSVPHPHFSFPSEFRMICVCEFGAVPQDPQAVCLSLLFFLLFLSLFPLLGFPAEPLCWMVPTAGFSYTISIGFFLNFSQLITIPYSSTYYSNFLSPCSLFSLALWADVRHPNSHLWLVIPCLGFLNFYQIHLSCEPPIFSWLSVCLFFYLVGFLFFIYLFLIVCCHCFCFCLGKFFDWLVLGSFVNWIFLVSHNVLARLLLFRNWFRVGLFALIYSVLHCSFPLTNSVFLAVCGDSNSLLFVLSQPVTW